MSEAPDARGERSPAGGWIRRPRRPEGWVAPGPAPAQEPPADALPGPSEDLCMLTGDWRILQRIDGHRWSLDDLVTAWMAVEAVAEPPGRFCDLGCGIGSVLMMLGWAFPRAVGVGIEAQAVSVELARRSVRWNGAEGRLRVLRGDLRDAEVPEAAFDLVTGTPPYFDVERATMSTAVQKGPCRFELRGGVEAYVEAAALRVREGGAIVLVGGAGQRARMEAAAASFGWYARRVLTVTPRAGRAPLLVVAVLARGEGETEAWAGTVRDAAGQWTPWFQGVRARMGLPPRP